MDTGSALGISGLVFSILGIVYSAVNHKHIKSKCCGKEYDISIDIESTDDTKEREAKEAKEKEEKEAKEKEEKEANEKEAKEKDAKIGKDKPFSTYTIFKNNPRIMPHFDI
jgi:predicted Holliday junction resolvase-like endonuclease